MNRLLYLGILLFLNGIFATREINLCNGVDCNLELNRGLLFIKERDIIVTNDKWTIALTIRVQDFRALAQSTEDILDYLTLQSEKEEIKDILQKAELNRLQHLVDHIEGEILSFELMLPAAPTPPPFREKRGLINFGGETFKFLFGTLAESDLIQLNLKLDKLDLKNQYIQHVEHEQLTYIKQLGTELDLHQGILNETLESVITLINEVTLLNTSLWTELNYIEHVVGKSLVISSLLREMELTLAIIQKELLELRQCLDVTATGHLSSLLVPPQNLSDILQDVSLRLPHGLTLITATDIDAVYAYYDLAKVHAVSIRTGIRLFIDIPLQSSDRSFELFSINPFPYKDTLLNKSIMLSTSEEYIAASTTGQLFIFPTSNYINRCQGTVVSICPADLPLLSSKKSCALSLFLNNKDLAIKYCNRIILPDDFEPVIIRLPHTNSWLYSLSTKIRITWNCLNATEVRTEYIENTGILLETQKCYIYSAAFVLLPHIKGDSSSTIYRPSILLPTITDVMTEVEKQRLQHIISLPVNHEHNLQNLINRLSTHTVQPTVDAIFQEYEGARQNTAPSFWLVVWLSILSLMLCFLIFKYLNLNLKTTFTNCQTCLNRDDTFSSDCPLCSTSTELQRPLNPSTLNSTSESTPEPAVRFIARTNQVVTPI